MRRAWDFDDNRNGFSYRDDVFLFTEEPDYAGGHRGASRALDGGALKVRLGGRDNADITDMSGGWEKSFDLDAREDASLTLRFKLTQSKGYERGEHSEVRVSIDGRDVGLGGEDYVARLSGDGNGGQRQTTGWVEVTLDLGTLDPGTHTIALGGYNNQKTTKHELTKIWFDDVVLETRAPAVAGLEDFERRVLNLTNEFRADNGLAPLRNDARLNAAAEDWSREMATGDFFEHSTAEQVEEQGYDWSNWGENIAAGYPTPDAVVQGWIDSPGHRANLLNEDFEEIGVGYHFLADDGGDLNYRHYWTQTFGTEAAGDLIV